MTDPNEVAAAMPSTQPHPSDELLPDSEDAPARSCIPAHNRSMFGL